MHEDDRLKRVLHKWEAPKPSAALDYRVLSGYRGEKLEQPWWIRRVMVPVPVMLGVLVVLVGLFVWRTTPQQPLRAPQVRTLVAESSEGASYTTVGDFSGFQPAKEAVVRIERRKQ